MLVSLHVFTLHQFTILSLYSLFFSFFSLHIFFCFFRVFSRFVLLKLSYFFPATFHPLSFLLFFLVFSPYFPIYYSYFIRIVSLHFNPLICLTCFPLPSSIYLVSSFPLSFPPLSFLHLFFLLVHSHKGLFVFPSLAGLWDSRLPVTCTASSVHRSYIGSVFIAGS